MIADAIVKVDCDRVGCQEEAYIPLPARSGGTYYFRLESIELELQERELWIVQDGRHFCSEECLRRAGLVLATKEHN